MSHYKPYPAYRDSGVEWIGEVPEHWEVKPVYSIATVRNGYPFKSELFKTEGIESDRLIRIRDIIGDGDSIFTEEVCPENAAISNGDVVIGMDGDFNVHRWLRGPAKLNQRMCAVAGRSEAITLFLSKCLSIPLLVINDLAYATTVKHLSSYEILHSKIPVPPANELNKINAAINCETARIDALITKKTRFIELLKEKRQALITHAVTKGLDPNVKMKDSGVEWIGGVPEHWDVKPLKIVASCNDDSLPESMPLDMPIRYVDISAVSHDGGISRAESMMFGDAPSRARRRAKLGDVVVSTVRTYLKAVASVDEAHTDCVYSTGFAVLRARSEQLAPEFLKWLVLNDLLIQAVESHSEGLSYPAINSSELVNLKTVVPGLPEQKRIAATLDRETSRIDLLTEKTQRSIDLLKERRAAFITAAVTGQIDLRESV